MPHSIFHAKHVQCQHLIPAFNARAARADYTTERLIATHFPGHGCMYDVTNERSLDWFNNVPGLIFDMLYMGVCATRHWQASGRLVQDLNVRTVHAHPNTLFLIFFG